MAAIWEAVHLRRARGRATTCVQGSNGAGAKKAVGVPAEQAALRHQQEAQGVSQELFKSEINSRMLNVFTRGYIPSQLHNQSPDIEIGLQYMPPARNAA